MTAMRIKWLMMAMVAVLMVATSCKTTEENYRAAYEIAAERKMGGNASMNRDLRGFIEREKRLAETRVVAGDSVRMVTERVTMVDGENANMHRYNVVVGDFKQVFNARSFRNRINEAEGNNDQSYVVMDPQKLYYVVYKGFDTEEAAAEFLCNKDNFKILVPKKDPWIVELP